MRDPLPMQGVDVFCERCGTLQPRREANTPRSAGVLARRVLDAVGITESSSAPTEEWLRLCLGCRGYSCPTCWNETEGVCQTCSPLPEPAVVQAPQVEAVPEPLVLPSALEPVYVAPQPEPVYVAPEPEPEPELEPVYVVPEPAYVAPEPEPELEPVYAVPEPEPVYVTPELDPEPVYVAPERDPRPDTPRMPVLPLPPPRPANAPVIPLPSLPTYPVSPQIAFSANAESVARAAATPAFEPHMLLVPPSTAPSPSQAGLRPCGNCQLTLSARAHFCRRCGTAQPN